MRYILVIILILLPVHVYAECVVLLHGLARTYRSMNKLEKSLQNEGYNVVNVDYPSTKAPIEKLADKIIPEAVAECPSGTPVSFVTHSLGGILIRQYLSIHKIPGLDRVVMLGPPNKGSEVVDTLHAFPGFHALNGDAGMQLGTGPDSVPNSLGKADFDLGIIAGTTSINLILSMIIPGNDDGKVSIERTKLEGMRDHIEVEASHPFLMRDDKAIDQVIHFLKTGRFKRVPDTDQDSH